MLINLAAFSLRTWVLVLTGDTHIPVIVNKLALFIVCVSGSARFTFSAKPLLNGTFFLRHILISTAFPANKFSVGKH